MAAVDKGEKTVAAEKSAARTVETSARHVSASAPSQVPDFVFTAKATGLFAIRGTGFAASGVVKINGHQALTTAWGNEHIDGKLPAAVKAGTVTVEVITSGKTQRGTFTL